jgi:short-subunit dehydrogenase
VSDNQQDPHVLSKTAIMSQFYSNKVAIVTGSTQGLGRELALEILRRGGYVITNGRSEQRKEETLQIYKEYEDSVRYIAGDVSKPETAEKLVQTALKEFGRLDILINNAGTLAFGNLENADFNSIKNVIDSNVTGSIMVASRAITPLRETKGSIHFISSLVAIQGLGANSLYSGAKKAMVGIAESLRKEMEPLGIHVGVTYLGYTKNDSIKRAYNTEGKLVPIPNRKGVPVASQEESVKLILKQIEQRKFSVIQSWLGFVFFHVNRFLPGLVHRIILRRYLKQSKEGEYK